MILTKLPKADAGDNQWTSSVLFDIDINAAKNLAFNS